jgi:hypothetical protein
MTVIDPDLLRLLKRLKLGAVAPTLPERLALARGQQLDYGAFLTLLLADEVQRRDQVNLERRVLQAGFEEVVSLECARAGGSPSAAGALHPALPRAA